MRSRSIWRLPPIRGLVTCMILLLVPPSGRSQTSLAGVRAPSHQPILAREWIEAGKIVDASNPTWEELQAELEQGFARALAAGLVALTNDLPGARRQFITAAHEAGQLGSGELKQAQLGLRYVDALAALQQAESPDAFTSSWAQVQETEATLPASWPRVGTNMAVRVVKTRIDATLEAGPGRKVASDPLPGLLDAIETLEIVTAVQRDNPHQLRDPILNRTARNLTGSELMSYAENYLQWLDSLGPQLEAKYPAEFERRRRDIDRVRSRLTRY